ncbi:MAG: hypothetical protein QOK05_582 [Chloroflexota bacterium]|jgi:TQXA domain-containing protein|nr:hypothetical protein [Chloroflexota bacterium]
MPDTTILTGSQLRRRYVAELRSMQRRPRARAAMLFAASLLCLFVAPALADGPHTFHLQGTGIDTEFVNHPYAMAPGTIAGRHYNLQAGLLGFTDGHGPAGTGYCIDARTHRRHDAAYTDGPRVDAGTVTNSAAVRWLLRHGYPNGKPLLGDGLGGLARSSSVVQAAIWHFSDGFDLDLAGRPFVDAAYRAAYDGLLQAATGAAPVGRPLLTLKAPLGNSVPADLSHPRFQVSVRVSSDDGSPAPDGTEVLVSSDATGLAALRGAPSPHPASAPLKVVTSGGRAVVIVAYDPRSAAEISVTARADLATPPGRVLVSSVPTQRLVETTWGRETVEATTHVRVIPRPSPTPTVTPSPTPNATPSPTATPRVFNSPPPTPTPPAAPTPESTPPPVHPPTPPLPTTGHDARLSVGVSALLAFAGIGVLWRARRSGVGP